MTLERSPTVSRMALIVISHIWFQPYRSLVLCECWRFHLLNLKGHAIHTLRFFLTIVTSHHACNLLITCKCYYKNKRCVLRRKCWNTNGKNKDRCITDIHGKRGFTFRAKALRRRGPSLETYLTKDLRWKHLGAIHTSELDRSEIDLSPKRSACERSTTNWDRSKIDLNECEHFLKANWDRSKWVWTLSQNKLRSI